MVTWNFAFCVMQKAACFSLKKGEEGPDDATPAHFVSHSAYFARRTTGVNGVACGVYFFNLPRLKYVV